MARTRVLITVKTYPSLSTKYNELVCTAGLTEEGDWIRIYPIKFRELEYVHKYSKYQWIEIDIVRNTSDFRSESYRPITLDTVPTVLNKVETNGNWLERRRLVLNKVYDNFETLISEAKQAPKYKSLAVFKPTEVIGFKIEQVSREWKPKKLEAIKQLGLFEQVGARRTPLRKLPFKFSYVFKDVTGKKRTLMIEDWEIGALFWRYHDEEEACQKVKEKYFDDFAKRKDLHFYVGTTKAKHMIAKNPFVIIGTFHPPYLPASASTPQLDLFS
ncbi:hypothetical protein BWI93_15805 [Siphonobacter sp. BAB-5385]|uniref:hypothetical protein n=1 Tax=Siphonobacter sp. BAB-5385 TaxID=1864822 RepID=UPI000B9E2AFC|nr:hypothetical protein [Siphonobacter sp. BAB-5385]OZI07231.1 hypothetical protein BWI93_15805 [Siphonobacter sp. BAB-5385]